jgi:addiction module HigA family antidote
MELNMTERIILTAGDVLRMEYLEPLGLSKYMLAKSISVSPTLIGKIVKGTQNITVDMALRLSMFFGNTAQFWINLQNLCELDKTKEEFKIKKIVIVPYKYKPTREEKTLKKYLA